MNTHIILLVSAPFYNLPCKDPFQEKFKEYWDTICNVYVS